VPQLLEVSGELKRKTVPFRLLKSESGDVGQFSGVCSVFHNVDACREIIAPGAFADTIPHFLSDGFVTYEHDWDEPIGRPTAAEETAEGLRVTGEIYPEMFEAASVLAGMRRGVIKQMSIGYYVRDCKNLSYDDTIKYWDSVGYEPTPDDYRLANAGVVLLTNLKLEEAAICMRGANNQARVTGVKSYLKTVLGELFGTKPEMQSAQDQKHIDLLTDQIWKSIRPAIRAEVSTLLSGTKAAAKQETGSAKDAAAISSTASSALLEAERLLIDLEVEAALGRGK
jgi:HK97 family phage prohead protease